jgi:hypothetical protein
VAQTRPAPRPSESQPDNSGNKAMYGNRPWRGILSGDGAVPATARPLLASISRHASSK